MVVARDRCQDILAVDHRHRLGPNDIGSPQRHPSCDQGDDSHHRHTERSAERSALRLDAQEDFLRFVVRFHAFVTLSSLQNRRAWTDFVKWSVMQRAPWTCPQCGRALGLKNQEHVCGHYDFESHFEGKDAIGRIAYDWICERFESLGPYDVLVMKTMIAFAEGVN